MGTLESLIQLDSREPYRETYCDICGAVECTVNHTEENEELSC